MTAAEAEWRNREGPNRLGEATWNDWVSRCSRGSAPLRGPLAGLLLLPPRSIREGLGGLPQPLASRCLLAFVSAIFGLQLTVPLLLVLRKRYCAS